MKDLADLIRALASLVWLILATSAARARSGFEPMMYAGSSCLWATRASLQLHSDQ